MSCPHHQETLSAELDGEPVDPHDLALAHRHAAACPACAAFVAGSARLHRLVRVAPAEPVPDLAAAILAAARPAPSRRAVTALRWVLATVAVAELVLMFPALLGGHDGSMSMPMPMHERHLGSIDIALAVAFAWAAWRPGRALAGVLPVAGALVGAMFLFTFIDVIEGMGQSMHLLNHLCALTGLAALAALWAITVGPTTRRRFTLAA